MSPVAFVKNSRITAEDDFWGNTISEIELEGDIPTDSLDGIELFSHLEIIFLFHKSTQPIQFSRHPRGNPDWPKMGIFAQRAKDRPNHIGTTIVQLTGRDKRILYIRNLDAIDGTPVLDIKPVMKEFSIDNQYIKQPFWVSELMKDYWK